MRGRSKQIIIILLILFSGILYYFISEPRPASVQISILNVIDGDTIDTSIGRIRLLGINTPEKNQPFYSEAVKFLAGKNLSIAGAELHGKDKYGRWLAYIFVEGLLLNEEILKNGFANVYVYEKDSYFEALEKAENYARENELGLWKKSDNFGCIELASLIYLDAEDSKNQEQLQIRNKCNFSISAIIKDDANHIEDVILPPGIFSKNYTSIWNDAGDTIYVRDNNGLLMFYRY
jgi:micrococcal nuclease